MQSPKLRIKAILRRAGLYHRLKTSLLHETYSKLAGNRWVDARDKQLNFYQRLLPSLNPGDLIFDIGANEGFKTDLFLRLGSRVIAIDPDDTNQAILREKFEKFRVFSKPLKIVGKAVSDKNALETMWIDGPGSAVNTLSEKWATTLKGNKARHTCGHCGLDFARQKTVETITLEQLFSEYGVPVFIKIDVEGYELNVIRSLKRPVRNLSFEVNLPEFRPEGLECVEILARLSPAGRFNYAVDCEQGLTLERWLSSEQFLELLAKCGESSIEVFWKGWADDASGTQAREFSVRT